MFVCCRLGTKTGAWFRETCSERYATIWYFVKHGWYPVCQPNLTMQSYQCLLSCETWMIPCLSAYSVLSVSLYDSWNIDGSLSVNLNGLCSPFSICVCYLVKHRLFHWQPLFSPFNTWVSELTLAMQAVQSLGSDLNSKPLASSSVGTKIVVLTAEKWCFLRLFPLNDCLKIDCKSQGWDSAVLTSTARNR